MQYTPLSQKLIELRKQHNYKQSDISNYLNISRSSYSQYENGYYVPSNELLLKLARLYKTDISQLINLDTVPIYVDKIADHSAQYDISDRLSISALNEFFTLCKIQEPDFSADNISQETLNLLSLYKQLDPDEQEDLLLFINCKLKRSDGQ